jgi:tight adherence protein C
MTLPMLALASFVLIGGLTFGVGVLLLRLMPAFREDRLGAPGPAEAIGSVLRWEEAPSDWRRAVERLGRRLTPRDTLGFERYQRRLVRAGFQDPRSVPLFLGAKAALGIAGVFAYWAYGIYVERALPNVIQVSVILGGLAFFAPDLWLKAKVRARMRDVDHALPDVLDLLMVCVEAGMGFDAAVARVAEQPGTQRSPLHLEVRAGRPREEAMRALADRVDTADVRSLVSSFIQTEKLGTSLGRTLRVQSDASRVQRRHRAEKKAQLAPLMMLMPTVVFLMPAFMLVAMAPPMLKMLQIFNTIGK